MENDNLFNFDQLRWPIQHPCVRISWLSTHCVQYDHNGALVCDLAILL
jgi:hypothetical protein